MVLGNRRLGIERGYCITIGFRWAELLSLPENCSGEKKPQNRGSDFDLCRFEKRKFARETATGLDSLDKSRFSVRRAEPLLLTQES